MHKRVSAVVRELYDLRLLDGDHGTYRINKLGILHMWSHGTRLTRHNTYQWEQTKGS